MRIRYSIRKKYDKIVVISNRKDLLIARTNNTFQGVEMKHNIVFYRRYKGHRASS